MTRLVATAFLILKFATFAIACDPSRLLAVRADGTVRPSTWSISPPSHSTLLAAHVSNKMAAPLLAHECFSQAPSVHSTALTSALIDPWTSFFNPPVPHSFDTASASPHHRALRGRSLPVVSSQAHHIVVDGVTIRSPALRLHTVPSASSLSAAPSLSRIHGTLVIPSSASMVPPVPVRRNAQGTPILAHASPPPQGFTLEGRIDLFAVSGLNAKFYKWKGLVPNGVELADEEAVYDKAVVEGDFKLSAVLPILSSTPFAGIVFRNATVIHQNAVFDPTKTIGWHLDVDLLIDKSSSPPLVYRALRTVLGVNETQIHLHADLGTKQSWREGLSVHSFTFDGSFPATQVRICKGLTLTSVGMELLGVRRTEPTSAIDYQFNILGLLNLDVPGSVIPLELRYDLREIGGLLRFEARPKNHSWDSPLGIDHLQLSHVSFSTALTHDAPMRSFNFQVSATIDYGPTGVVLSGSYASGGTFSLSAVLTDLSLHSFCNLLTSLTGKTLALPKFDVGIGSAKIIIDSETGLKIELEAVEVEGHTAPKALVDLASTGIIIEGSIVASDNSTISFGDIELTKPYLKVELSSSKTSRSGVALGGTVTFFEFSMDVLFRLYKDQHGGVQWSAISWLTSMGRSLALSEFVPELQGSFLDLNITKPIFTVASQDDPDVLSSFPVEQNLRKGVQVRAELSPIKALDALLRTEDSPTQGLLLSASWSKAEGFQLDVSMPSDTVVYLGNSIHTDPFVLRIQGGTEPKLILITGLEIPVKPQGETLRFSLSLDIDPNGASATAQMHGFWNNPFGISKNVVIGPNVDLSIGIVFAQFVTTGTPSEFGIVGGLQVGNVTANVAMQISEDPTHELLKGSVEELGVEDLVSFSNKLTGLSIPQPPRFVFFQEVELYICPADTVIGTIEYPKGFSFSASMTVFGKHASARCVVSNEVIIQGRLDNFALGPLIVQGTDGSNHSQVDIAIGSNRQHILIDGKIQLFDTEASLHAVVDLLPRPELIFHVNTQFTELLVFTVDARLIGQLTLNSLDTADFSLSADLHQDILRHVCGQIDALFAVTERKAQDGIENAQKRLETAQIQYEEAISAAERDLTVAHKAWDTKYQAVTEAAQKVIDDYLQKIGKLERSLEDAREDHDKALRKAHTAQHTKNNRAAAIHAAEQVRLYAKQKDQDAVEAATRKVELAKARLLRQFGHVEREIATIQTKIDNIQDEINRSNQDIDHYSGLAWYDIQRVVLPIFYLLKEQFETEKTTASEILKEAKARLLDSAYLVAQGHLQKAELALQRERKIGVESTTAAERAVDAAKEAYQAAVRGVENEFEELRKGDKYIVLQVAQAAVHEFKIANEAAYKAAQHAIDTVESLVEYRAFQAAQDVLARARADNKLLEILRGDLEVAKQATSIAPKAAQWVVDNALGLVDIRRIQLSGTLSGMTGASGGITKPFKASVEYVLAGKSGKSDFELDLSEVPRFTMSVFEHMVKEAKKLLG